MKFEEWWMDQEYDPMLYGPMSDAWAASQAATREEDVKKVAEFLSNTDLAEQVMRGMGK
jgi:hypothetical protein